MFAREGVDLQPMTPSLSSESLAPGGELGYGRKMFC